jgi:hypothetical protein
MIQLRPPKDFDTLLYYNFTVLICIAILQMFYSNGVTTIQYIDRTFPNSINEGLTVNNSMILWNYTRPLDDTLGSMMKYRADLTKQNLKIPYVILILYWGVIPLINWIYIFWWFRNKYIVALSGLSFILL